MSPFQNPQISTQEAVPTAVLRERVSMTELPGFYDRAFSAVGQALEVGGVQPAGPAFGYYLTAPTDTFELEAGFPLDAPLNAPAAEGGAVVAADGAVVAAGGGVVASELPAGLVAHATHAGGYDTLGASWQALTEWVQEQGRTAGPRMWEVYVTQPTPEADPATLRTDLFLTLVD